MSTDPIDDEVFEQVEQELEQWLAKQVIADVLESNLVGLLYGCADAIETVYYTALRYPGSAEYAFVRHHITVLGGDQTQLETWSGGSVCYDRIVPRARNDFILSQEGPLFEK